MKAQHVIDELESRYDMSNDNDWRGLKNYIKDLEEKVEEADAHYEKLQRVFRHGGS